MMRGDNPAKYVWIKDGPGSSRVTGATHLMIQVCTYDCFVFYSYLNLKPVFSLFKGTVKWKGNNEYLICCR